MSNTQPPLNPPSSACSLPPKCGLRARLFAWMMAQGNDTHDREIEPYKRELLSGLQGDLLEIGPGAGANFAYFSPDVRWVGVEPNPYMQPHLRAAAQGRAIDLRTGYTEALPVADNSMDIVVSTLVLCSVRDLNATLAEVQRVLKPGGRFIFIEHVAAPAGSELRRQQNWVRPLWAFIADGCQPNREIWQNLQAAPFGQLQLKHFSVNVPVVKPHIAGYAIK